MSDLVERLRARKEFFRNGGTWCMSPEPDADCAKAAREIERLTRALALIADLTPDDDAPTIARDALAGASAANHALAGTSLKPVSKVEGGSSSWEG